MPDHNYSQMPATPAPRDRRAVATATGLSLCIRIHVCCSNMLHAQAKTEHGRRNNPAGGMQTLPRATRRARIWRPAITVSFVLYALLAHVYPAHAQISVSDTAPVQDGSTVVWKFNNVPTATLNYQVRLAGPVNQLALLDQGQVNVVSGQATVSYTPTQPGVYTCSVVADTTSAAAHVAYRPFEISTSQAPPADWTTFWNSQKLLLDAVQPDVQVTYLSETPYTKTFTIDMAVVGSQRLYGYLTVPVGVGPFPAIIQLPPFGHVPHIVTPNVELVTRSGCIVLNLNVHPNPPNVAGPAEYASLGITNPTTVYYRHIILGVVRAINYLETRNDFNGKIGVMGESQGGGLAMLAAGIDNRISVLIQNFAALADHGGGALNLPNGFPHYYKIANEQNLDVQAVMQTVRYYDAAHAAQFFQGVAFYIIAYGDDVCPANSLFGALNRLTGNVVCLHAPTSGHGNNPPEYVDYNSPQGFLALLRRLWPETQTPPWPWPQTSKGRFLNTGNDQVLPGPGTINLVASVLDENTPWAYDSLRWVQTDGPAPVIINNPTQPTTSVTLSMPGTYELACRALKIMSGTEVVSLHDRIKVFVAGDAGDTIPPVLSLSTTQFTVGGPFIVKITPSEPVVGFTLSDISISNGTAQQFQVTEAGYNVLVNPQLPGQVIISIDAQVATDINGNPNVASTPLIINYINCAPLTGGSQIAGNEVVCIGLPAGPITNVQLPIGADSVHLWQSSINGSNGPWVDIGGVTGATYTSPVPTVTTWYRRWSKAAGCTGYQNGTVSNVVVKQVNDCSSSTLCDASAPVFAQNSSQQWIALVESGNVQQYSGPSAYTYFDQRVFRAAPGQTVDLRVGVGYGWETHNVYLSGWLDKNHDGYFDAIHESVVQAYLAAPPAGSGLSFINSTMTIPQDISPDTLKMRLVLSRDALLLPCDTVAHGEIEDYRFVARPKDGNQSDKSVYLLTPNPASKVAVLSWPGAADSPDEVLLVNTFGHEFGRWTPDAHTNVLAIDVADLPDSVYYVVIRRQPMANQIKLLVVFK